MSLPPPLTTMKSLAVLLLLSLAVHNGDAACGTDYKDLTPLHTRCFLDYPNATAVTLTEEDKTEILDAHNEVRGKVSNAGDMLKLSWRDDLAKTAEKWSLQCKFGHDNNRQEPAFKEPVGQNMYSAWSSAVVPAYNYSTPVHSWGSEIKDFIYGTWTSKAGHYIQEVNSKTQFVGCGAAVCNKKDSNGDPQIHKYFVCNYFPSTYTNKPPFVQDKPCALCPSHCSVNSKGDKICDCKNPPCVNGKVNIHTCKCDCDSVHTGDACIQDFCPNLTTSYSWCGLLSEETCKNDLYMNSCPRQCKHPACKSAT
ncbi:hypothetical protein ACOMHN_044502 [Nucella lapillus]